MTIRRMPTSYEQAKYKARRAWADIAWAACVVAGLYYVIRCAYGW